MGSLDISKLIFLLDPDDPGDPEMNLTQALINHSKISPKNGYDIWLGCSSTPGKILASIGKKLWYAGVPFSVYPGRPDQVKATADIASSFFLPFPVHYDSSIDILANKYREEFIFHAESSKRPYEIMAFVLTHPNCTAARVLGVDRYDPEHYIFSNDNLLQKLHDFEPIPEKIYLEGGSRNTSHGINSRLNLAALVRKEFPNSHIIGAGGITSPEDAMKLKASGYFDTILTSGAIHKVAGTETLKETMEYLERYIEICY
jgi:heptaprenylglyceryl phosphate synthase